MKRVKSESFSSRRFKLSHFLLGLAGFYLIFLALKFPHLVNMVATLSGDTELDGKVMDMDNADLSRPLVRSFHRGLDDEENFNGPSMPVADEKSTSKRVNPPEFRYGRITGEIMRHRNRTLHMSPIERMADEAWTLGSKAWEDVDKFDVSDIEESSLSEGNDKSCPSYISMTGQELDKTEGIMFLPCGLTASSSITIIGTPQYAHKESLPQVSRLKRGDGTVMVSQFMVELQGLNIVDGEDPPKIFHLNPRIGGDWSHKPVIEHNTCYRMQWGAAQRCDGIPSKNDVDMLVDGYQRCEKWMRNDMVDSKESKTNSWFKRFIGREQKPEVTWSFPFSEGRLFVLTLRAGIDGFHINVGGRHVSSFPYRLGFTLEDATGLAIKGDVDVHSAYATSLPTSHPSFSPHKALEFSPDWKAPPLPRSPFRLFIGVLSATNHFAERMAVRKTWMQHSAIKSSDVVARFFVALNPRSEVNAMLKREAEYFGDIVILPFMDHYELVVLKTIAICEFGVQNVTVPYIMKCDDDNFVRLEPILKEIDGVPPGKPLYMGNLNLRHRPLRTGKWAVTWEEWPENVYPPYANGPGYIISRNVAEYIISQNSKQKLRLFKMEDVSMGMWVEQFNASRTVQYTHSWKFCQYGCTLNYYTAHYQSPRQMMCLWEKLSRGRVQCCNFR
ncbi:PREDICTED: hydroxyproline O-galactosyltransferase GALT2-like [Tarenaya hassleriana]|uniref:hydroxyproline O-galactosyltransferase GALT2-like n=1 Tax=Tarenaya hassleriana TaxID=28532 RepID=UPI00053C19F0|nr:PREDICTED: hydroxyproline O-galactosyltransferase GALT2-like [Tarenaya hassleriana]